MAHQIDYPRVPGVRRQDLVELHQQNGYQATAVLGVGKFGTVLKARYTDRNHEYGTRDYAVKVLSLARIHALLPNHRPREMAASLLIDHPHCLKTEEVINMPGVRFVVMQLATNGSLSDFMAQHRGTLDHRLVRVWSVQIASALLYLHRVLRVAHREVNLGNLLLDRNNRVLLSGFTSIKLDRANARANHTRCGSGPYQAPEVFYGASHSPIVADVWSYGVVVFALLTHRFVCSQLESNNQELITSRVNRVVVEDARAVLLRALDTNPQHRSSMVQLMECPWLAAPLTH